LSIGAGAFALHTSDVSLAAQARGALGPELAIAAQRGALCSSANAVGVGLLGEYFGAAGFRGQKLISRVDPVIDFDSTFDRTSGSAAPIRSVRWQGWIRAPLGGDYRFHINLPSATLTVALRKLPQTPGDATVVSLAAGRFYPVLCEVPTLPEVIPERVRLEWTTPFGARYVIPRSLLHLPTEQAGKA
jgi:hypothetical protein